MVKFSTCPVNKAYQSFRKSLREYVKAGGGLFEHLLQVKLCGRPPQYAPAHCNLPVAGGLLSLA